MTDLDDIILKHLSEMSGEQVDKENMVRGISSILIQTVGRLEKMDLREDLMGQEWLRIERRIRRLEAHCGIAHEDGDDE